MSMTKASTKITWPLSSFPGAPVSQESAGRLTNCPAEPLGDPSAGPINVADMIIKIIESYKTRPDNFRPMKPYDV
jgi:hypothetical protein